eukprot:CAMPEP_0119003516 /NCGR_PEP_ID=MMETSP1176-20130426/607_1 /TAXON_ID=265551 /ORGANISM="Synedropsis recta cf, Strain CCMP1620" /LENGTH=357 /DNA_ID=CAMNT_0006955127 /DNA_START=72 /DNA_END=1145 /DNA_ORIENTATION=+
MNAGLSMFDNKVKGQQIPGVNANMIAPNASTEDPRIALFNSLSGADAANFSLLAQQQHNNNLTFTTPGAAQRSVLEVLARHKDTPSDGTDGAEKRKREDDSEPSSKKQRTNISNNSSNGDGASDSGLNTTQPNLGVSDDDDGPAPVAASEEGMSYFNDSDVLSGRGGGTNVHPGNRHFRDLINLHRRAYLKARKNDKPAISRAIVRTIRENTGRFLKRDEKSGLWYEIGDDAAREKTSQALRQRAPEMRKILFESEREQARQEAEDQIRQQQQLIASGLGGPTDLSGLGANFMNQGMNMLGQQGNPMFNPLLAMQMNKQSLGGQMNLPNDPYSQMSQNIMTAALLGGGINRFAPNGA